MRVWSGMQCVLPDPAAVNTPPPPRPTQNPTRRSWWQRTLRPLWALPGIILIMLVPIGAFTGDLIP